MKTNSVATLTFIVILGVGGIFAFATANVSYVGGIGIAVVSFLIAIVASSSTKVADQWDRAVVLRLGRFHVVGGPGLFLMIPVMDKISHWIDVRIIPTSFKAEKTLTKGLKQNSTIVVVHSSALETMQL